MSERAYFSLLLPEVERPVSSSREFKQATKIEFPLGFDRIPVFPESVWRYSEFIKSSGLKKAFFIVAAVTLALLLVSYRVFAAGEWRAIGQTVNGDTVSISALHVQKKNQRVALVRIEFKEPARLPQGGPFVEMRAHVRFNCNGGAATPTSEWFYSRDHGGRLVVSKKATHDNQFGKESEGGFADMLSKNVCSQAK